MKEIAGATCVLPLTHSTHYLTLLSPLTNYSPIPLPSILTPLHYTSKELRKLSDRARGNAIGPTLPLLVNHPLWHTLSGGYSWCKLSPARETRGAFVAGGTEIHNEGLISRGVADFIVLHFGGNQRRIRGWVVAKTLLKVHRYISLQLM